VFTFDEKIVSQLSEILKRNERRYSSYSEAKTKIQSLGLKNPFDYFRARKNNKTLPQNPEKAFKKDWEGWRKFLSLEQIVRAYTVSEAQKVMKEGSILTRDQYALYTALIYEDDRMLPTLKELDEKGVSEKFGFKSIEDAQRDNFDFWDVAPAQYIHEIFPQGPTDGIWKLEAKGVSDYIMTKEERAAALDELIVLGKGKKKPWHIHSDQDYKDWLELYGITTIEEESGAREHMGNLLDKMQRAGVLPKELFLPVNYYNFCEIVLSDIVDPYGNKAYGNRIVKTPPKLHSWSPPQA